jgi:hypothetical protein
MKVCGLITMPEKFEWTPTILLEMINEVDKICPEEGMLNISNNQRVDTDQRLTPE